MAQLHKLAGKFKLLKKLSTWQQVATGLGKVREKYFFNVRELSGNFKICQGNLKEAIPLAEVGPDIVSEAHPCQVAVLIIHQVAPANSAFG